MDISQYRLDALRRCKHDVQTWERAMPGFLFCGDGEEKIYNSKAQCH